MQLIVDAATPIPMEQAEAREKLWTPEDARRSQADKADTDTAGKPAPAGKLWTPGDPR
jgi:hypothetical protein